MHRQRGLRGGGMAAPAAAANFSVPKHSPSGADECGQRAECDEDRRTANAQRSQADKAERDDSGEAREAGEHGDKPRALIMVGDELNGMEGGQEGELPTAAQESEGDVDDDGRRCRRQHAEGSTREGGCRPKQRGLTAVRGRRERPDGAMKASALSNRRQMRWSLTAPSRRTAEDRRCHNLRSRSLPPGAATRTTTIRR